TIYRVADQRMADIREVNADLVGSPGGKAAFDERCLGFECLLDAIARQRRFSLPRSDYGHFLTVDGAAPDVAGDLARWRDGNPQDKGGVGPRDRGSGKTPPQGGGSCRGFGNDYQPALILVEAMDDPRRAAPANAREARPAMGKQGVDKSSCRISGSGVDD